MKQKKQSRAEFWRAQVRDWETFNGSATEFCRQRGLNLAPFYSWRKQIRSEQRSQFVPVEILPGEPSCQLPNPKWLAELIYHLTHGVRA